MQITVIGTGYVGLSVGTCLAEMGNNVICVDNNKEKLNLLEQGIIPIYEPGLEELIISNVKEKRLMFSDNIKNAIELSEICFIAVGTPQKEDGSADLSQVFNVAESIGKHLNNYKVIVDKSTVPVGTAEKIKEIIKSKTTINFDIVSNPEFLKQGAAVEDFLKPDRVIIGSDSQKATEIMKELYAPFLRTGNPIITMNVKAAEMTKYAANSFLALKISFMNEMANLCEKLNVDINDVRIGISSDSRIGNKFLFPGLGYGGSCFPKDIKSLIKMGEENNYEMNILKAADLTNFNQRKLFIDKICKYFNNDIRNKTFAIWGLSFKPKTNDMREAPSIDIINLLLEKGAKIKVFDPKAIENAKNIFQNKIIYSKNSYEAIENTDALLLLTEWNEFRHPDFNKVKSLRKNPVIFDGRNQYDKEKLKEEGFKYFSIG